jgi:hypothetical protein
MLNLSRLGKLPTTERSMACFRSLLEKLLALKYVSKEVLLCLPHDVVQTSSKKDDKKPVAEASTSKASSSKAPVKEEKKEVKPANDLKASLKRKHSTEEVTKPASGSTATKGKAVVSKGKGKAAAKDEDEDESMDEEESMRREQEQQDLEAMMDIVRRFSR